MTTLIIIGILLIVLMAGLAVSAWIWGKQMVVKHCCYIPKEDG